MSYLAAAAFLLPILQRSNLTVTTGALVTRLLFEGTCAVGVEYLYEGNLHQVRVNQEVILSAGAFDSPKLLMLSGIGNAAHLQAMEISVVVDLPGVGQLKALRVETMAPTYDLQQVSAKYQQILSEYSAIDV